MKVTSPLLALCLGLGLGFGLVAGVPSARAADPGLALAQKLDTLQTGATFVRLQLLVQNEAGEDLSTLQLQIKERQTPQSHDVLYQVLYPRERRGEAVLLSRKGDAPPSGFHFTPPDRLTPISAAELDQSLFGTDLAYRDVIENFFAWKDQKLAGEESIGNDACQVLVSRPSEPRDSAHASVKSWIDAERLVPLRVEKADKAGTLLLRIDTTRVHQTDEGEHIPASLYIRRAGSKTVTELKGSRNKTGVAYEADTFTTAKMTDLRAPRG